MTKTDLIDKNFIRAITLRWNWTKPCNENWERPNLDGSQMTKDYNWKASVNGKELKLLRKVFEETSLRVACFMFVPRNKLIKAAKKGEAVKENSSVEDKVVSMMSLIQIKVELQWENISFEEEIFYNAWEKKRKTGNCLWGKI